MSTRVLRWLRREPWRAAGAALLVFSLAIGGAYVARLPELRAAETMRRESDYDATIARALVAFGRRDETACLEAFDRALTLVPGRAEAQALRAVALKNFRGVEAATAALESAIAASPEVPDDLQRARVWMWRRQGRDAEAQALEVLLGPPATATALLLTVASLTGGEMSAEVRREAYRMMSLAVRIAPRPRFLLHAQWATLAPPEAAREVVDSLLHLWPDQPLALHLAGAKLVATEPARALELLGRATALGLDAGSQPLNHLNQAAAHTRLGQAGEAVAAVEAALAGKLMPTHRTAALDLLRSFDAEAAERACRDWVAREPGEPLALRKLAQQLSFAEQNVEAIECMRRAAAARPQDPEYQYDLAVVLDSSGDSPAAVAPLRAVLALDPTNDRAHKRLLGVLRDLRDADGVLAELQRRCQVSAGDVVAWTGLAATLLACERVDDALRAAEQADYQGGGKDAAALEVRAQVLDKLGETMAAERCRERAADVRAAAGGAPESPSGGR